MKKETQKPELLLPAGNPESFYAAAEGGADAVYFGLKEFNARKKADNFTSPQLMSLIQEAGRYKMKTYLTLNTVIKNTELSSVLDTLDLLSQTGISGIIIQDWGLYYLAKTYFPGLALHASTQMSNHNSAGAKFSEQCGFERVIFARELTKNELSAIIAKSNIEAEMFVHGALCYSLSGMCSFSSYLGGNSANRGLCTQPCRRVYQDGEEKRYIFSLKDNQLIDYIPQIMDMGVSSLKIEGRIKPAEYIYTVAKAYRKALDNPDNIAEAKSLLYYDFGREKTSYFFGGEVNESITETPSTGVYLGNVSYAGSETFSFFSNENVQQGTRLWIRSKEGETRESVKLNSFSVYARGMVEVNQPVANIKKGDHVYMANSGDITYPNEFSANAEKPSPQLSGKRKNTILQDLSREKKIKKEQYFVRIDSIKWLKKLHTARFDNIIINLDEKEWNKLDVSAFLLQKNAEKIIFEFPKYIPEFKIPFYKNLFADFYKNGFKKFMVSHLSQIQLVPKGALYSANENVYIFNDAALAHVKRQGVGLFCYPRENDMDNLLAMKNKMGIIPVYFTPELFYSRMPVKTNDTFITDDKNYTFRVENRNRLTIALPDKPVSMSQYMNRFRDAGFGRFLIDLSYEKPSDKRVDTIIKYVKKAQQINPSTSFNFKSGLR